MSTQAPGYRTPTNTTAPVAGTTAGLWPIEEEGKARAHCLLITQGMACPGCPVDFPPAPTAEHRAVRTPPTGRPAGHRRCDDRPRR